MAPHVTFAPSGVESPAARVVEFPADSSAREILEKLRGKGVQHPLVALAEAVSRSSPARKLASTVIAVRENPHPLMVFLGPEVGRDQRLARLPGLLSDAGARLRPLSWADAEAAAAALAAKLRDLLSPDALEFARFLAVPRGGLIAAALVAYALPVSRDRIGVAGDEAAVTRQGKPVVLIDDCIISGVRLRQVLQGLDGDEIVVASLYSPPEVRRAVESAEPAVATCVSGADLRDHGGALLGDDYATWKKVWMGRVPERYAAVLTDLVAFPWSEPEVRMWDDETGSVEAHWSLSPPQLCFRTRVAEPAMEIQFADERPGIERLADAVVPIDTGDGVFLIDGWRREGVALHDTAAELWREWMSSDEDVTVRRLLERYDVSEARLRADLARVLEGLRERGILTSSD